MNTINREHFEAWLFSQPDERTFIYTEGAADAPIGCLLCNFIREQTNITAFYVGASYLTTENKTEPLMVWFSLFCPNKSYKFTAKEAKDNYLTLFPNAIVGSNDNSANVEILSSNSIAPVTESNRTNMLNSPSKQ